MMKKIKSEVAEDLRHRSPTRCGVVVYICEKNSTAVTSKNTHFLLPKVCQVARVTPHQNTKLPNRDMSGSNNRGRDTGECPMPNQTTTSSCSLTFEKSTNSRYGPQTRRSSDPHEHQSRSWEFYITVGQCLLVGHLRARDEVSRQTVLGPEGEPGAPRQSFPCPLSSITVPEIRSQWIRDVRVNRLLRHKAWFALCAIGHRSAIQRRRRVDSRTGKGIFAFRNEVTAGRAAT